MFLRVVSPYFFARRRGSIRVRVPGNISCEENFYNGGGRTFIESINNNRDPCVEVLRIFYNLVLYTDTIKWFLF